MGDEAIIFSKLLGLKRSLGTHEPAKNRSAGGQTENLPPRHSAKVCSQECRREWLLVGDGRCGMEPGQIIFRKPYLPSRYSKPSLSVPWLRKFGSY